MFSIVRDKINVGVIADMEHLLAFDRDPDWKSSVLTSGCNVHMCFTDDPVTAAFHAAELIYDHKAEFVFHLTGRFETDQELKPESVLFCSMNKWMQQNPDRDFAVIPISDAPTFHDFKGRVDSARFRVSETMVVREFTEPDEETDSLTCLSDLADAVLLSCGLATIACAPILLHQVRPQVAVRFLEHLIKGI